MKKPIITRAARIRALAIAGTAAAALVLAGCSSGTGETAPSEEGNSEGTEGSASALETKVAGFMQARDAYDLPSEAVTDSAALEGTTVYYIPITIQAPQFSLTAKVLEQSTAAVGAKLEVCNGDGTPSTISQCIDGATNNASTSTIILDGFFIGMAANSAMAAQAAGINVISSNQAPMPDFPASETLGYVNAPGTDMFIEVASWIALDSGGTGNQLVLLSTDGPINSGFVENGLAEAEADCPDCTISTLDISSANFGQVASDLSARLLQDPNIQYVNAQYAQFLPVVLPAVADGGGQQVGTGASTLGALQAVAGGQVAAASGQSATFGAWALIDTALRMANGQEVYDYVIPTRLFTADNIGEVELTEEAEASGEWYGPTTFADDFTKLWGRA